MTITCDPTALQAVRDFALPENYGFGRVMMPAMIMANYRQGEWEEPKLIPYRPLHLDPTSKVLHYGQEIFEGLKAYYVDSETPQLFRPEENAKRFNRSANRLAMANFDEKLFVECAHKLVSVCAEGIPRKSGHSLYLRPTLIASEKHIGIKPAEEFIFLMLATPVGPYFQGDTIKVLIEREFVRACPGGTGAAKTGGNYAAALIGSVKAKKLGFDQPLWLDAIEHRYVEELSGMNLFFLIDNELHTPSLTDTILPGITRASIIELAKDMGIKVHERRIDISELQRSIENGGCTEGFACGTAAIVAPLTSLHEVEGKSFQFSQQNLSLKIRKKLLDIQEGRDVGPKGWIQRVSLDS